jgi:hypothetical protein
MNELISLLSVNEVTLGGEFHEGVMAGIVKDKNSDLVVAIKVEDDISLKDFIAVYLKPAIDAIIVAR